MPNLEGRIPHDKSIIVGTDVEANLLEKLVADTQSVEGIGGYKVGFQLALTQGLSQTVATIRDNTDLPVIFDFQKAGNDIPAMGIPFANICKQAGVDAAILLPFAGGKTERHWIQALQDVGVGVIVGGHMTNKEFLFDEGGVIHPDGPRRIYEIAAEQGVTDFVVPGTKLNYVAEYKALLDDILGEGTFSLYSPGFITQGGSITDMAQVAGDNWHAIVGSAIYQAIDMKKAAEQAVMQIRA